MNSQRGKLLYTPDLNPEQQVIFDTFEYFNPLSPFIDAYTDSATEVNDLNEGKPVSVLSTDSSNVLLDVAAAGLDSTPVGQLMSLPSWFNAWYNVGADLAKNF